jgi:hypothetical protein
MSPPTRRSLRTRCGIAAALALAVSLAAAVPAAWAGDSLAGSWAPSAAAESLFSRAWSWLSSLWDADSAAPPSETGTGGDHRCTVDPNGSDCMGSGGGPGGGTSVPPGPGSVGYSH